MVVDGEGGSIFLALFYGRHKCMTPWLIFKEKSYIQTHTNKDVVALLVI